MSKSQPGSGVYLICPSFVVHHAPLTYKIALVVERLLGMMFFILFFIAWSSTIGRKP